MRPGLAVFVDRDLQGPATRRSNLHRDGRRHQCKRNESPHGQRRERPCPHPAYARCDRHYSRAFNAATTSMRCIRLDTSQLETAAAAPTTKIENTKTRACITNGTR